MDSSEPFYSGRGFRPAFEYDGSLGDLYPLVLKNLLFTVLTLGIYRFWGVTNIRRYAWSHMRFQGERFVYTGTGGEMFKGALVAGFILLVVGLVLGGLQAVLGLPQYAVSAFTGFLYALLGFAAAYAAQRYRLSRTAWRGIRGGMAPGIWSYSTFCLGQSLLTGITLGFYGPAATVRTARRRIGAASFGNLPFVCTARATDLYAVFWFVFGALLLLAAVLGVIAYAATRAAGPDALQEGAGWLPVLYGALGVVFYLGGLLIGSFYAAASRRTVENATTLGPLRFRNTISGWDLAWLVTGNLLIIVFTLGFGYPIVLQRRLRLTARTVLVEGEIDGATLEQNRFARPASGEGLLSQLDPSGAF